MADNLTSVLDVRRLALALSMVLAMVLLHTASSRMSTQLQASIRLEAEVRRSLSELLSTIKDAETGQRGFLLTGNDAYLEPYYNARVTAKERLYQTQRLLEESEFETDSLAVIYGLIQQKFDELALTIRWKREGDHDSALAVVKTDVGKDIMGEIRSHVAKLLADKEKHLQMVEEDYRRAIIAVEFLSYASIAVFFLSVWLLVKYLREGFAKQVAYEQELRESRARLEVALQASGAGVWSWNIKENTNYWDERMEALFGMEPGSFGGDYESWARAVLPEDREQAEAAVQKTFEEDRPYDVSYRIVAKGEVRNVRAIANVIRDADDEPLFLTGICLDRTDELRAEQQLRDYAGQLERSNKELEQFAYIASHDLQEPLRTIMSHTQLIREEMDVSAEPVAEKAMGYVVQAASRMSQIIHALLEYSRLGKHTEMERVDLATTVADIVLDLQSSIEEAGAQISVGRLPTIRGNAVELRLLLQNLLSNALKFRESGRTLEIAVEARTVGRRTRIEVRDNGIGIPEEYRDKVFRIFQRLHSHDRIAGTGIGLAHCQKIVDVHGGTIRVASNQPHGSTFVVELPIS